MPAALDAAEARVLGCLVEKEAATPEYYPLTLNSLRNACNQSSSRYPVVSYDDATVSQALATLREKGLIRIVYSPSNRAAKYRHVLDEKLALDEAGRAVMCLLLLRGPQTVGELRTRSDRLYSFASLEEVEAVLSGLARREEPLVVRLERAAGQKEARYRQLLAEEAPPPPTSVPAQAGPPRAEEAAGLTEQGGREVTAPAGDGALCREIQELRSHLADLDRQMSELRSELADLRRAARPYSEPGD